MNDQRAVLVTGAAGLVGRHVAIACADTGRPVVTIDIHRAAPQVRERTRFRQHCDPADADVLAEIRAFAAVLHNAGISSTIVDDGPDLEAANVAGPMAIARVGADGGTAFVYVSSRRVYVSIRRRVAVVEDAGEPLCSGPLNAYARSKLQFDECTAAGWRGSSDGLRWFDPRYTNVFRTGEGHQGAMASSLSRLLRRAAAEDELRLFADSLTACRGYVSVDTVPRTSVRLVGELAPAGVYNLGLGHATSFATLVAWCAALAAGPLTVRLVPNPVNARNRCWTCADVHKLDAAALPSRPAVGPEDARHASEVLFHALRAGWT